VTVYLTHDSVKLSASAVLLEEFRGLIVVHSQKEGTLDHTKGDREAKEEPPILCINESVLRKVRFNGQGDTDKVRNHDAQGDQDLGRGAKGSF